MCDNKHDDSDPTKNEYYDFWFTIYMTGIVVGLTVGGLIGSFIGFYFLRSWIL